MNTEEKDQNKVSKLRELVDKILIYEEERHLLNETMKETKQQYIDDGVLTKEEMKALIKAIRIAKDGTDVDWLVSAIEICNGEI